MTRRRVALIGIATAALVALVSAGGWAWASTHSTRPGTRGTNSGPGMMPRYGTGSGYASPGPGYGPGMMGSGNRARVMGSGSGSGSGYGPGMMGGTGYGPGMMGAGFGVAGDGKPVTSMDAARSRAQLFAGGYGLHTGEVIQFSNGFYVELLAADGTGATEVLVDPAGGAVSLEYGPAMMWNTRYGVHATGATPAPKVSPADAAKLAQRWLDTSQPGLVAGTPDTFPGYYTLETLRSGKIVGMMSVNASTGAVWYHTWHGTFVAESDD